MKKYFRIKTGYGKMDFIRITTPQDLEKAIYLYITKKDGFVNNGQPLRGVDIITITEDWNKALGVADDWTLTSEDVGLLTSRGIKKEYAGILKKYKERVDFLIDNGQAHLIGQKVDIPELNAPKVKEISEGAKRLAEGMKM